MGNKPEVFLEIGAGFLRIPTSEINYNITVIDSGGTATTVVAPPTIITPSSSSECDDDFYKTLSNNLYQDIGALAKNLSSTITDIPAEDRKLERATLDQAGEKIEGAKAQLRDIVEMTEKATMEIMDSVESVQGESLTIKSLLEELKGHAAFSQKAVDTDEVAEENGDDSPLITEVKGLTADIDEALVLIDGLGSAEEVPPPVLEKTSRYLFDLDVIFQTLYELCTNETVKDHITDARGKVADLFDIEAFQDKISEKAVTYEADSDNYFDVPMSDVFQSLFAVCSDKGIKNLLKKMDSGQSSIFLDQAIPLEVPEIKEIETETAMVAEPVQSVSSEGVESVTKLLNKIKDGLCNVPDRAADHATHNAANSCSAMTIADQQDIFAKIEAAFDVSTTITSDVSKITEVLSFQDLSGQQILKIIKLLNDFQVQLLAIVVRFGSQLKQKSDNANISVEESTLSAQKDVERYIAEVPEGSDGGLLDQSMVNTMLTEFGFD